MAAVVRMKSQYILLKSLLLLGWKTLRNNLQELINQFVDLMRFPGFLHASSKRIFRRKTKVCAS